MIIAVSTLGPADRLELTAKNAGKMLEDPYVYLNSPNIGVVKAYQHLYESLSEHDVIVYLHDDVEIHEPEWWVRVQQEFLEPRVAVVGFGGAMGLGVKDIYKTPYRIEQLARQEYYSNQRDWEVHGLRETEVRRVAVVDGFAMAVSTEFLKVVGGWGWIKSDFHCYDLAMCLMAARLGWKVKMVGVDSTHYGGGSSTKAEYIDWLKEHGRTAEQDHSEPHRWLYSEFIDQIPLRVNP